MKYNRLKKVVDEKSLNDYQKYIAEIKEVVNKYANMPSVEWNMEEIKEELDKYVTLTSDYISSNYEYINKNILISIRESLFDLNYFICLDNYGNTKNNYLSVCYNTAPYYLKSEDNKSTMIEKNYYKQKTIDLIDRIGSKYDFNINIPFNDSKHYQLITEGYAGVCLSYLFDILRGDFSGLSFKIKRNRDNEIDCDIMYMSNDKQRIFYINSYFMKKIILKSYSAMLKNNDLGFMKKLSK